MNFLARLSVLISLPLVLAAGGPVYWDWQLGAPYDLDVEAKLLIIEPDDQDRRTVMALRARGVTPYCYISVGSLEDWRDDADKFPHHVIGKPLGGWPGERYLDARELDTLLPLMRARMKTCADKGFLGVEADNIDLHHNDTGFGISRAEAVAYVRALTATAHDLGLKIGQKNATDLAPDLQPVMDFLLLEECIEYGFCHEARPYLNVGKDVLDVEYAVPKGQHSALCAMSEKLGLHVLFKEKQVTAGGTACG